MRLLLLTVALLAGIQAAPSLSSSYGAPLGEPLGAIRQPELSLPEEDLLPITFQEQQQQQSNIQTDATQVEEFEDFNGFNLGSGDAAENSFGTGASSSSFSSSSSSSSASDDSSSPLSLSSDIQLSSSSGIQSSSSSSDSNEITHRGADDGSITNIGIFQTGIRSLDQIKDASAFERANAGVLKCDTEPITDTATITNVMDMPRTTYKVRTFAQSVTTQRIFTKDVKETKTVTYMTRILATSTNVVTKPVTKRVTRQLNDETFYNTYTQIALKTKYVPQTRSLLHTHVFTNLKYETLTTTYTADRYYPQTYTTEAQITYTPAAQPITKLQTQTAYVTATNIPFITLRTSTQVVTETTRMLRNVKGDTTTIVNTIDQTQTHYRTSTAVQTRVSTIIHDELATRHQTNIKTVTDTSTRLVESTTYVPRLVTATESLTDWATKTDTITLTNTVVQPSKVLEVYITNNYGASKRLEADSFDISTTTLTAYKSSATPFVVTKTISRPCSTAVADSGYGGYELTIDPSQTSYY